MIRNILYKEFLLPSTLKILMLVNRGKEDKFNSNLQLRTIGVYRHYRNYFIYTVATSFIGAGNRNTRIKSSTCHKSFTKFYTYNALTSSTLEFNSQPFKPVFKEYVQFCSLRLINHKVVYEKGKLFQTRLCKYNLFKIEHIP